MAKLRHCYPVNHRPARLNERKKYYSTLNFSLIEKWFSEKNEQLQKPIFHLDPGNETGYIRKKYREIRGSLAYFSIANFSELKEMVMDYLPEDLYYDRNIYKDPDKCADCERRGDGCLACKEVLGQELMFDVDPENIDCPNCGTLDDRVNGHTMFKFCYICFNRAIDQSIAMYKRLESLGYKKLSAVYSGRGFHIYVEDEIACRMSFPERKKLAGQIMDEGYAIDPWVTEGEARLARVPYSLNGMVSRVCFPIEIGEIKKLDFWRSRPFVPGFL
jgi:DNA primase catalytic subunit